MSPIDPTSARGAGAREALARPLFAGAARLPEIVRVIATACALIACAAAPAHPARMPELPLPAREIHPPLPIPGEPWIWTAWPLVAPPSLARNPAEDGALVPGEDRALTALGAAWVEEGAPAAGEGLLVDLSEHALLARDRASASLVLGAALLERGEGASAAEAFAAAAEQKAGEGDAWKIGFWEAAALLRAGDEERAAAVLAATASSPELLRARAGRNGARAREARLAALEWVAAIEARNGRPQEARRFLRQGLIEAVGPGEADSLVLRIAESHFAEGAWDSVVALFQERPAQGGETPLRNFLHGKACFELDDLACAEEKLGLASQPAANLDAPLRREAIATRAWMALAAGETERAVELYDSIEKEPGVDAPFARYGSALAHLQAGELEQAEQRLSSKASLPETDPLHDRWIYALALVHFRMQRYPQTLEDLDGFKARADSLGRAAWTLRGDANYRLGNAKAALESYGRAASLQADPPEPLLRRQAIASLATGRWGAAARILGDLTLKFPGTARASEYHFWRGEAFLRLGRLEEARRQYGRAEQLGADALRCAYRIGLCFQEDGRYAEALAALERAAILCGRCDLAADIGFARADCLARLGRKEEAARVRSAAQRAIRSVGQGTGEESTLDEAWALLKLEDYSAARSEFARIREQSVLPRVRARALLGEALALQQSGDEAGALERFSTVAKDPAATDTLRVRASWEAGETAFRLGRRAEAAEWYRRVIDDPESGDRVRAAAQAALFACGIESGDWELSKGALEALGRADPAQLQRGRLHCLLGEELLAAKRFEDAARVYEQALKLAGGDAQSATEARFGLARAIEGQGRTLEAAGQFAEIGLQGSGERAADALARAGASYLALGDPRRALSVLERRAGLALAPSQAAENHALLARAYDALGEKRAARNEWEQVAQPGAEVADSLRAAGSLHLGRAAFDRQEWRSAWRAFAAADSLGLSPLSKRPAYWAGESAMRMGSPGIAAAWLERSLAKGEGTALEQAAARMRLGDCYEALSRSGDARAQYERVAALRDSEAKPVVAEALQRIARLASAASDSGGLR